jgi:hypothetical protein
MANSFDEKKIQNAIDAGKDTHGLVQQNTNVGDFSITAECIDVVVEKNQVCVELPFGLGTYCFSAPIHIPNGTSLKACLKVLFKGPFPSGIELTLSFDGIVIFSKKFEF